MVGQGHCHPAPASPSVGQGAAPPGKMNVRRRAAGQSCSPRPFSQVPGRTTPPASRCWPAAFPTANNLFLRGKKYICKRWFCWVGAEVWAGGDAQVEFLLGLGHRRLGGRETERSGKLFSP